MKAAVMATAANKATLKLGDLIEVDGRPYEVVIDRDGEVALEPAVAQTIDEIHAELGSRPATPEEFEALLGDLPSDGEG